MCNLNTIGLKVNRLWTFKEWPSKLLKLKPSKLLKHKPLKLTEVDQQQLRDDPGKKLNRLKDYVEIRALARQSLVMLDDIDDASPWLSFAP